MNEMDVVPRLSRGEKLYVTVGGSDGQKTSRLVHLEQKSLSWMKDLVETFSPPGEVVVDLFSGTFPTAKARLELPRHRRFLGCEVKPNCFEASIEGLV